ncbi:MAG: tRNA lysidine(34) synthetase TilS [bacterium]|nr:tRNA lysidine(34) synthetase TilS [bacterium]
MPRPLELTNAARRLGELVATACPDAPGPGVVVALSGGPDSVALLRVAAHWARQAGAPLVAAHLNHGLRPGDADRDEAFCADLCARLGIGFACGTADPRAVARERGLGLEEAARHLRRGFLRDVLAERPWPGCVATGHHRDDQAETVLMRLLRGTGPEGLRGILPVDGPFIHPLLEWDRAAIVGLLERLGQPWRVDVTNHDGDNLRARLRREVVPLLRGVFGDGCLAGPARLAGLLADDLALLNEQAAAALVAAADGPALRVEALLALPPALAGRVLRAWLGDPERLEAVHVAAVLEWLREGTSGSGLDLPGGRRLSREFGRLLPGTPAGGAAEAAGAGVRGSAQDPAMRPEDWRPDVQRLDTMAADGQSLLDGSGIGDRTDPLTWRLVCPAAVLKGSLRVRGWRRGDRLRPLGLGGSRKVSDVLREARVPVSERGGVLVVDDEEGILWVVGLARDERTRLLPGMTGMVTISVIRRHYPTTRGTRAT